MLDFSSALYLGFRHPHRTLGSWDDLTTGRPAALYEPPLPRTLEAALANLVGLERSVLGSSSLHLVWDFFGQLSAQRWVVLIDAEAYPVAQWGAERAAGRGVNVKRFPHHDAGALERRLQQLGGRRPLVVTDGFCPLCGQGAPLGAYLGALRRRGGLLLLDDTQALGVLGKGPSPGQPYGYGGGGSLAYANVVGDDILLVASLAKGFGAPLAVLAGSGRHLRDFRKRSDTRVHCSPPSNAALSAARRALCLNRRVGDPLRSRLAARVRYFGGRSGELGVCLTGGAFPVQSLSGPQVGVAPLYQRLLRRGVRAVLQRGHRGAPQLSFLINVDHTEAELDRLVDALRCPTGLGSRPFFTPFGR